MTTTINAKSTGIGGLDVTCDASGSLGLQTGGVTALTIDTSQNITTAGNIRLNNGAADGAQVILASSGYSDWNLDNYSGRFRAYYNATEYFTIDTSGNVGIGIASPSSYNAAGRNIVVGTTSNVDSGITIASGTTATSYLLFAKGTTGSDSYNGYIGYKQDSNYMQFNVNGGVERMRIDSSGNVLVNKTSQSNTGRLEIDYSRSTHAGSNYNETSSLSSCTHIAFQRGGTAVGSIQSANNSSTSYNTSSDYRLKENIVPMTGALNKVALLKPVTYIWKTDGSNSQGFIAHELQEIVPECVTGEKDAVDAEGKPVYQGVDTSFLVATLTAAIQEQQTIINDLKARIETLETK